MIKEAIAMSIKIRPYEPHDVAEMTASGMKSWRTVWLSLRKSR